MDIIQEDIYALKVFVKQLVMMYNSVHMLAHKNATSI